MPDAELEHLPNHTGEWCRRCYRDLTNGACHDDAPTEGDITLRDTTTDTA